MSKRQAITDALNQLNEAAKSLETATDAELGKEVQDLIKEAQENERHRIARLLGHVANLIHSDQLKDYPSNVLDLLRAYFEGWHTMLSVDQEGVPIYKLLISALKKAEEEVK